MSHATAETIWPPNAPPPIVGFVAEFFSLLDAETPEAARKWAQLYVADGEFICGPTTCTGHEEISQNRIKFWAAFPGLRHRVKKVYFQQPDGRDLICITRFKVKFRNGSVHEQDTAANFQFVEEASRLLLKKVELYMDPTMLASGAARF
ncbi:hypothetical protein DBV05_g7507 [Lasiodiplodia theobromae]|uniref:SnoaL-like domain-containing protein n=1 Tax=Lasiodiplodia theobromae TaxID=45133 RepID=A0A5N5D874_9PEZI|nr:hypothetical protein DBV05_g7507 [Lasiodiplodia theobromae]